MKALLATAWRWLGGDYVRMAIAAGIVAAVALGIWRLAEWRGAYHALPVVAAERDAARRLLLAEHECRDDSRCAARARQAAADGEAAVAAAVAAAAERASREAAAREAEGRAAVDRAAAAAREARVKADAWAARYREATRSDVACQRWANTQVPCPVE